MSLPASPRVTEGQARTARLHPAEDLQLQVYKIRVTAKHFHCSLHAPGILHSHNILSSLARISLVLDIYSRIYRWNFHPKCWMKNFIQLGFGVTALYGNSRSLPLLLRPEGFFFSNKYYSFFLFISKNLCQFDQFRSLGLVPVVPVPRWGPPPPR